MRIITGRGRNRNSIVIPTGKNVGVTLEHVGQLQSIMESSGVVFKG